MKKHPCNWLTFIIATVLCFHLISCKDDPEETSVTQNGIGIDENLVREALQNKSIQAVDLGLSVKWANMNVGANIPLDYGDYFAWGETSPKPTYELSSYKWYNGSDIYMSKYCTDISYGTVDNLITLELTDDAANATWGDTWRMPTNEEFRELNSSCTWKWISMDGNNGYIVIGPNGNFIFFPVAGYRNQEDLFDAGAYGYYWSSSLNTSNALNGRFFFYNRYRSMNEGAYYRYMGLSVRPVTE